MKKPKIVKANGRTRYEALSSHRSQFLNAAIRCSELTLPGLIIDDISQSKGAKQITKTPWQSVGAKGVVTLSSKLMLALLPPQTAFFKFHLKQARLQGEVPPEVQEELELSFARLEKAVMESIAGSTDRVIVHQAIKHLVVAGNVLCYAGKDAMKVYPLNRYVVDRDGMGNVYEIVTKESVNLEYLMDEFPDLAERINKEVQDKNDKEYERCDEDVDVYTHITRKGKNFVWYQEVLGEVIPGSESMSPIETSPWLVLRFNVVDGESYGRGRVEEYLGDLNALEALMQALVEGSAVAAKIIYLVDPAGVTKQATLASAPNGGVIPGKAGNVEVLQVNKAMDFRTAQEMVSILTQRISEAFLVMNVRQSERTTAEEVRMTQMELEQQLGGLFSLLTVEFLIPYLNSKLKRLQDSGEISKIPKDIVKPAIVAGINALGRGQDFQSLMEFNAAVMQSYGQEALAKYTDAHVGIRRMAAAKGIETLDYIKSKGQMDQEQKQAIAMQKDMMTTSQQGQIASAPINDPSKNPALAAQLEGEAQGQGVAVPPVQE